MLPTSVFCIATGRDQADRIVDQLKASDFSGRHISVLFTDKSTTTKDPVHEKTTRASEGAVAGAATAATAAVPGGAAGANVDIGPLAIPGVGPFLAAGPIRATLSGATADAAKAGIAGGLIGLGIPELEAKRYEGKVQDGKILLSVGTENPEETKRAKEIFAKARAHDILTTGEATPAPNAPKAKKDTAGATPGGQGVIVAGKK